MARATLVVGVSGFMYGGGPMHAGALAATGFVLAVIACLAALDLF